MARFFLDIKIGRGQLQSETSTELFLHEDLLFLVEE